MKEIFQTLKQGFKENPKEMIEISTFIAGAIGFLWVVMFIYNQLV